MNMQRRSEERSKQLHKEIARKLRSNPDLWEIPKRNLRQWKEMKDHLNPAYIEWEHILLKQTKEQILAILESDSEESRRLRSSSPFTGILSQTERKKIFDSYKKMRKRNLS